MSVGQYIGAAVKKYGFLTKGPYEYMDLLQMVWEEYLNSHYDKSKAALSTYIYLIAWRVIINTYNREPDVNYETFEMPTYQEPFENGQIIKEGIMKLPLEQRFVVWASFLKDLDTNEIAELMKISPGRVSQIKKEALENMKRILKKKGINEKNYRDYITYN
jgi:RNA polymerase sigma factor (sigma-70 family)